MDSREFEHGPGRPIFLPISAAGSGRVPPLNRTSPIDLAARATGAAWGHPNQPKGYPQCGAARECWLGFEVRRRSRDNPTRAIRAGGALSCGATPDEEGKKHKLVTYRSAHVGSLCHQRCAAPGPFWPLTGFGGHHTVHAGPPPIVSCFWPRLQPQGVACAPPKCGALALSPPPQLAQSDAGRRNLGGLRQHAILSSPSLDHATMTTTGHAAALSAPSCRTNGRPRRSREHARGHQALGRGRPAAARCSSGRRPGAAEALAHRRSGGAQHGPQAFRCVGRAREQAGPQGSWVSECHDLGASSPPSDFPCRHELFRCAQSDTPMGTCLGCG